MGLPVKKLNQLFLKGFIVVMPMTLTLYLLWALSVKTESIFGNLIKSLIGEDLYVPGLGILLTVIIIFSVGILVSNYLTGKIINWFLSQFEKVPFLRAIYNPLKDLMSLFGGNSQDRMKRVVLVHYEPLNLKCLGLVTREDFDEVPGLLDDRIAVYIPMSYMLGGFTALIPRESVQEVDIPVDQAVKLAITGWIKAEKPGND